jgi:hypothetical protein
MRTAKFRITYSGMLDLLLDPTVQAKKCINEKYMPPAFSSEQILNDCCSRVPVNVTACFCGVPV